MELDPFAKEIPVSQAHDQAVGCRRGNFEGGWNTRAIDDQQMIARGCKLVVNYRKDRSTIMQYFTRFSMHNIWRAHNFSAKCLPDRLVPQANTEDRNFAGEAVNEIECDPCMVRFARP